MPIDLKNYHKDWKKISLFVRRLKAQNRCEFCDISNYAVLRRHDKTDDIEIAPVLPTSYKEARILADRANERELPFVEQKDPMFEGWSRWIVIVLTVAHFDHDTTNNELDNLFALCQKCHNNHDIEYRKKNRTTTRKTKTGQSELFD